MRHYYSYYFLKMGLSKHFKPKVFKSNTEDIEKNHARPPQKSIQNTFRLLPSKTHFLCSVPLRVIYFKDIYSLPTQSSSVLKNGLHSTTVLVRGNFCWQNVKSLLAQRNCFILHSPFVWGTLIVLRPLRGPPVRCTTSLQHEAFCENKRKLFGKLCSHRLVFPNQKVRKIGIVF